MFYRDSNGQVVGVLCDWDLAASAEEIGKDDPLAIDQDFYKSVKGRITDPSREIGTQKVSSKLPAIYNNLLVEHETEDETTHKCKARYRTGTGPFMAMDLLQEGNPPIHLYRHDLESFFWVLAYFVITHNPTQHTIGCIKQWTSRNLISVGMAKASFLSSPSTQDFIAARMDPQYVPIWKSALWKLGRIFRRIHRQLERVMDWQIEYVNAEEEGRSKDQARAASKLESIAKKRASAIDYNTFMDHLL